MWKPRTLTLTLALSCLAAHAWASPSLRGASGGVLLPDAQVLPEGTLAATGSSVWVDTAGKTRANEWYSLTYAPISQLEIGVSRVVYRTLPTTHWLFQAKFQALPEKGLRPALTFGALDMTNELDLREATAYATLGAILWAPRDEFSGEPVNPLRGFVGLGSGLYGRSFFGGAEWDVYRNARVVVEYGKDLSLGATRPVFNLGAQIPIGRNIILNGGAVDMRHPYAGLTLQADHLLP